MTTPVFRRLQQAAPSTFLAAALVISYLHLVAEKNIRGSIPADSDSLAYQNSALQDLSLWQKGQLTPHRFLFGEGPPHSVPPLHRWTQDIGYLVLGINNHSPYILSGLWLSLAALGLFLNVRYLCNSGFFALASGLLLLGVPAGLNYGFMASRNDWPVTGLCLMGFYFFCSSDRFRSRSRTVWGSLFWGLALLTKSSVVGYLAFPTVFLFGLLVWRLRSLSRDQIINLISGALVVSLVAGWFYAACYRDVLHYYSFWAAVNQANVRIQYQLDSAWAGHLFYARNLLPQLGYSGLAILAAGFARLAFAWRKCSRNLAANAPLILSWALCFAVGPYIVLLARRSYAAPVDINMLPFLLLLALAGLWLSLDSASARSLLAKGLLAVAVGTNLTSLAAHHRANVYHGIDPAGTASQLFNLLSNQRYYKVRLFTLHQDIYFNAATILNVALRDPALRGRFDLSLPEYTLEERSSPLLSTRERYTALAEKADVLLVSDRQKGMQWLTINRQWQELRSLVSQDPRFVLLGRITAYDDGTALDVHAKERAWLETTADGWLINGAALRFFGRAGKRTVSMIGTPIGSSAIDLSLIRKDGERIPGRREDNEGSRVFQFVIPVEGESEEFTVLCETPAVPSRLGASTDARELVLANPKARVHQ